MWFWPYLICSKSHFWNILHQICSKLNEHMLSIYSNMMIVLFCLYGAKIKILNHMDLFRCQNITQTNYNYWYILSGL
jgi:hypothetical protein